MYHSPTICSSLGVRRGLATLELALALPVLALVAAVLFTTARAGLTRLHTTLEARQKAWKQRHKAAGRNSIAIRLSPQDLVQGQAVQPVPGPPMLSALLPENARSRHAVLAGSLDYHDLPLDNPPELSFAQNMAKAAVPSGGGSLDSLLSGLPGISSLVEGKLGGMLNQVSESQQQIDLYRRQIADAKRELEQKRRDLQDQIKATERKVRQFSEAVDRFKKQLDDLDKQRKQIEDSKNNKDKKDKDKTKKTLDAIDRQKKTIRARETAEEEQLDAAKQELLRLRFSELADKHLAPR